jgi:acetyl-CoA carboxylase carboxyltransferase component
MAGLREATAAIDAEEEILRAGGGPAGQERQRALGRLPVRERLAALFDPGTAFLELGLWAAWRMYPEWGAVPAAGIVTGIGTISGQPCLVAANDATVKAGAMFPQSVKKLIRCQKIAHRLRLPLVYLVDSAGVFLPLQDEIFPDEDDFGRIFRNNAVLSAEGLPQFAAVMGNCIAGGAYLPVLCDKILMTEGSQLCLAGPALVKAAVGQTVDPEELGGAAMHAGTSGTIDFREPDDAACLARLRALVGLLPPRAGFPPAACGGPERGVEDVYGIVPADGRGEYEVRDVLACIVDAGSFQEFRAEFGKTLVTGYARIGGRPAGIVANARRRATDARGEVQIGGVMYGDAAEKAARFVDDCEQNRIPLVFLQDVQGFMVGRQAEQSGIIRAGARLVRSMSTATVPKFTVIVGSSYGAGHYAMCGRAYDPALILAWPNARYAVMGGSQAADTLLALRVRDAEKAGRPLTAAQVAELRESIRSRYQEETDIRHAAARGWVDAIIRPHETRAWLAAALAVIRPGDLARPAAVERDV